MSASSARLTSGLLAGVIVLAVLAGVFVSVFLAWVVKMRVKKARAGGGGVRGRSGSRIESGGGRGVMMQDFTGNNRVQPPLRHEARPAGAPTRAKREPLPYGNIRHIPAPVESTNITGTINAAESGPLMPTRKRKRETLREPEDAFMSGARSHPPTTNAARSQAKAGKFFGEDVSNVFEAMQAAQGSRGESQQRAEMKRTG